MYLINGKFLINTYQLKNIPRFKKVPDDIIRCIVNMIDPNYYDRQKELKHFFRICKTDGMSYKTILEYYLVIKRKILHKRLSKEEDKYLDSIWKQPNGWYSNLEICSHCGYYILIRDIEKNIKSKVNIMDLEELKNYIL